MAQISARTATWAKWAVIPAALLVSGVAVSQASYSAFSDSTSNTGNSWTAGTVKLANNAPATAMFTAANLKPGDTGTKCITVTSSGSLVSTVKLYATAATTTNLLSSSIDLVITQGAGGDAACTGFVPLTTGAGVYDGSLASLGTTATNFSTGVGNWTTTGSASETRTYKITYTLKTDAPNTTQGGTAGLGFTWEAQNS